MYPQRELTRLNAYKAALLRDIASNRAQCTKAARRASQPLAWLDRSWAIWRKIGPLTVFAAVPLGFILKRTVFSRLKILGSLARWGPIAFAGLQSFRSMAARNAAPRTHARQKQPDQAQATWDNEGGSIPSTRPAQSGSRDQR